MKSQLPMLAFRLIICLVLIVFGANAVWKAHRLEQGGKPAEGTITQFVSGKNSHYVFWFPVGRETYWGTVSGNFNVGQKVEVRYEPSNPGNYAALGSDEINPGWIFCTFGLVFGATSVLIYKKGGRLGKTS